MLSPQAASQCWWVQWLLLVLAGAWAGQGRDDTSGGVFINSLSEDADRTPKALGGRCTLPGEQR